MVKLLRQRKFLLPTGPKQKFLYRLQGNPTDGRKVAITLPRIYFEMTGIDYDASRKTPATQKYKTVINDNGNEVRTQYVPVPYNISFEVGILCKSQDDGLQILEQILPFFQPSFSMSLKFIPDMDEVRDVAVVLNSVDFDDDWEDDFSTRRSITYTMQFTAKSYIYVLTPRQMLFVSLVLLKLLVIPMSIRDTLNYLTHPKQKQTSTKMVKLLLLMTH